MISHLRGVVAAVGLSDVVVEVGGVGLSVQCSPGTIARLRVGAEAQLATTLVVREDSLTLYGFADDDQRGLFELLQTASGVGPRVAQAILAVHSPDAIRTAIATGDVKALTQVSGIGKKGAERLIVELKDRIGSVSQTSNSRSTHTNTREQVIGGIMALGWSANQAEHAADRALNDTTASGDDITVPTVLKRAIALLGRTR